MLDIIEFDLFKKIMPEVTYLRLDGSIPPGQRHSVVTRFNNDPSIDVLLLTTQVGGLGLNLTGADTVIFVEHDWNPMKDLQAMDRAHRIGQRKVVNVYRLITRGTLEEKIMGFVLLFVNFVSFFYLYAVLFHFCVQFTKVQSPDSQHCDQRREQPHGDNGHRPTARSLLAQTRRIGRVCHRRQRPPPRRRACHSRGAARAVG